MMSAAHVGASARSGPQALPQSVGSLSRLVASRLRKAGLPVEEILRAANLPPQLLVDPQVQVGVRQQIDFVNLAASAIGDPLLGFHVALECDMRSIGPLYYVMASAATLGEALQREERYTCTLNEGVRIVRRRTGELTTDVEYVGVERHRDVHQVEFWRTTTLRKARLLTGLNLVPTLVSFVHPRSVGVEEMNSYFGRSILFGAEHDRVSFAASDSDLPIVTADPHLSNFLLRYHEQALAQRHRKPGTLRTRVENVLTRRLPHGTADIGHVARDLGLSTRTLSRRLAEEGQSFQSILSDLRSELVTRYLENDELSIAEIAWLLGYTNTDAFARAHRQRTGKTPSEWRRTRPGLTAPS